MDTAADVTLDLDVAFSTAGVGFALHIRPGSAEKGAALHLALQTLEDGKQARFSRESSYALADFIGGFCRWLGTKSVTASHTETDVTGQFHPRYTVPQMLATTQELCQMLEDKFGAYPHSILSS